MHLSISRMWNSVSAKVNFRTNLLSMKDYFIIVKSHIIWNTCTYYRQIRDFNTFPSVWPSFSNTNVHDDSLSSVFSNWKWNIHHWFSHLNVHNFLGAVMVFLSKTKSKRPTFRYIDLFQLFHQITYNCYWRH